MPTYLSNATLNSTATSPTCSIVLEDGLKPFRIDYETQCPSRWNMLIVLIIVEALTAFFHIVYVCELRWGTDVCAWWTKNRQAHLTRWIEYGTFCVLRFVIPV